MQFAYKLVCVNERFSKPIALYRGENSAYKFIEAILEEYEYCRKVMKKYCNKNLIMNENEGENFQLSNTCWICEKFIEDEKVRDRSHISYNWKI